MPRGSSRAAGINMPLAPNRGRDLVRDRNQDRVRIRDRDLILALRVPIPVRQVLTLVLAPITRITPTSTSIEM